MFNFFRFTFSRFALAGITALSVIILSANSVAAIPLAQYRQNVHRAVVVLDALQSSDAPERAANQSAALREVRKLLPANQKVETGQSAELEIDNSWFETNLKNYENAAAGKNAVGERVKFLQAAAERLSAIEDRLTELETARTKTVSQNADKQKLDEILQRPEFQKPSEDKSVLERWLDAIVKWLGSFARGSTLVEPNQPHIDLSPLGTILNYVIIGLAIAIIGFIGWRFLLPLVGATRGRKKPGKKEPRVILGERIAADETAADLLTQADRLAQAGEVRAAIRKGYIAALCDLSDRKVLGLARHKTNRDYLSDVKKRDEIYQPMSGMTGIFERHWYGDVPAEQADWQIFRGKYQEAVQNSKFKK